MFLKDNTLSYQTKIFTFPGVAVKHFHLNFYLHHQLAWVQLISLTSRQELKLYLKGYCSGCCFLLYYCLFILQHFSLLKQAGGCLLQIDKISSEPLHYFNSFMTEIPIIKKLVHWFALQINDWFLVWYGPPSRKK